MGRFRFEISDFEEPTLNAQRGEMARIVGEKFFSRVGSRVCYGARNDSSDFDFGFVRRGCFAGAGGGVGVRFCAARHDELDVDVQERRRGRGKAGRVENRDGRDGAAERVSGCGTAQAREDRRARAVVARSVGQSL